MINLNDIQIFVGTAQAGTINAAAKTFGVPASTVSRALTRLEKAVDIQLLRRTTRGVVLTDAGRDYLEQCAATLERLEEAQEMLGRHRTRPHGTLRLGMPSTFARDVLTPMLRHFLTDYPEIRLQIFFNSGRVSPSLDDKLDILFQLGKPKDSSLRVKNFSPIPLGIYASPKYIKTRGLPADPSALRGHSCIGYAPKDSAVWHFKSKAGKQSVKLALRVSVADPVIQTQLTIDDFGIGQLPAWTALPQVEAGNLVVVLPGWQSESLHFHALYAERAGLTPKIKVFLEFIERYVSTEYNPPSSHNHSSDLFQTPLK